MRDFEILLIVANMNKELLKELSKCEIYSAFFFAAVERREKKRSKRIRTENSSHTL